MLIPSAASIMISLQAQAELNPYQELLNAVTTCAAPNNPLMNGVEVLGGNRMLIAGFSANTVGGSDIQIAVTKVVASTLQVGRGRLVLHTEVPKVHGAIECQLSVIALPDGPPDLFKK